MPPRSWNLEQRSAIGRRLLWARELVCPNRSEFARKMQVHPSMILRIEAGEKGPGIRLLQDMCHALRISYDYLVDGQLTGVDPELLDLLLAYHPELETEWRRDIQRKGSQTSTLRRTRKLQPSWAAPA